MGITVEQIQAALDAAQVPTNQRPTDNDCLTWEPIITEVLTLAGLPARGRLVVGWIDLPVRAVLFMHQATEVDGIMVDFTARQYHLRHALPARWVAPAAQYAADLAEATGANKVTIVSDGFRSWEESIV